ncbi:glutathione transferase GstA [Noviherbaspirillum sp.]|uniref:glutathione transferase GstA n=1 Tax=Noviherbaspirillum sp. TaxID=1926288 RepID=UPI002B48BAA9|nr:glutathione transferase GstA [Noviherbaspirillum sp.]HJV83228.1 glutathione transferase GstA [Noviherbaspirillum sp.]
MKLFYATGTCSLSPHIVLLETGLPFDVEKVDLATGKTASGADYLSINPKGYVPTLQLDSGEYLTEGPAIVQYVADLVPQKRLAPPAGSMERYRLIEWLNFISTELHKAFGTLFHQAPQETKQAARETLAKRIAIVDKQLRTHEHLAGNQFSVADAYLFTVLSWARPLKFDLSGWPAVQAYLQRVAARSTVHAAMVAEGLIKA